MRSEIPRPFRKPGFQMAFSIALLPTSRDRMMLFGRGVMRISFRYDDFHFRHGDHRQEPNEEEEERSEDSKRADECPDIDPGWNEQTPRRREKVAMQSADDDDETFEPHAGVDAHADEINNVDIAPAPSEPKELRRKRIAEKHADPPVPPVGTEDAIIEC